MNEMTVLVSLTVLTVFILWNAEILDTCNRVVTHPSPLKKTDMLYKLTHSPFQINQIIHKTWGLVVKSRIKIELLLKGALFVILQNFFPRLCVSRRLPMPFQQKRGAVPSAPQSPYNITKHLCLLHVLPITASFFITTVTSNKLQDVYNKYAFSDA